MSEFRDIKKIILTTKELADFWGLTDRMVREYAEKGMPKMDRNTFNLKDCNDWFLNYKDEMFRKELEENSDLEREKTRLTKAQAKLKELELAEKEKELITVDIFSKELERIVIAVKSKMQAFPQKAAPKVLGLETINQVKLALIKQVNELLKDLAKTPGYIRSASKLNRKGTKNSKSVKSAAGS